MGRWEGRGDKGVCRRWGRAGRRSAMQAAGRAAGRQRRRGLGGWRATETRRRGRAAGARSPDGALHDGHGAHGARGGKEAAKGGLALHRHPLPEGVGVGAGVQAAHLRGMQQDGQARPCQWEVQGGATGLRQPGPAGGIQAAAAAAAAAWPALTALSWAGGPAAQDHATKCTWLRQGGAHVLDGGTLHGRRRQALARQPPPLQLRHSLAQERFGLVALRRWALGG